MTAATPIVLTVLLLSCGGRRAPLHGLCDPGQDRALAGKASPCASGLQCRHGGPDNVGTCEIDCTSDADCPPGLICNLEPGADEVADVCVEPRPPAPSDES
jgi:hypothetical protein